MRSKSSFCLALFLCPFAAGGTQKLKVYVTPPISAGGFVEAVGTAGSVDDLKPRLHDNVVDSIQDADFVVVVYERGVEDGDNYYVRAKIVAAGYENEIAAASEAGFFNDDPWERCADGLAEQIQAWADANRAKLIGMRGKPAPSPASPLPSSSGSQDHRTACDEGNLADCVALGLSRSVGPDRDYAKAGLLFRKACDGGEVKGCHFLALLHENGWGVPPDMTKAEQLYEKACSGGYQPACKAIGQTPRPPDTED